MIEDAELLRRYAADRSEAAFAELVQRHLALVYSVARRQVEPDRHLAEDVAQKVFADLARKAGPLSHHPVLTGWLYRSAQFTAIDLVRSERRRRAREQEAQTMQELNAYSETTADTEPLRPVLDQIMSELNDRERDALMLRFFEGRPFAEVGARLRLTEDAARMKVERALEKMRSLLVRRGVTSTTAVLATALAGQAGVAAPMGLAATVTGGALAGTVATTALLPAPLLGLSLMTKLQVGITAAIALAGAGLTLSSSQAEARLRKEREGFNDSAQEIAGLRQENHQLAQIAAEVESYRGDAAELERLKREAGALVERAQEAKRQQELAAQARAAATTVKIYDLAEVDQIPVVTSSPRPAYPFDLRRAGITGQAVVSFVVDANGEIQDVQGVSATHPEFAAVALESVKKWKFTAGQKAGIPVGVRMQVPVVFSFDEKK